MSYHSRKKAEKKAAMEKMQPEKDFNFCYGNFFKPILHVISSTVETNITDINNLNQTYIDIVKMISVLSDANITLQRKLESDSTPYLTNYSTIIDNSNEDRSIKQKIILDIDVEIKDYLIHIHNAQVGLMHFNNLYQDNIKDFNISHLTTKCIDDIEISNFETVRKEVCTYAPIALVKYVMNTTQENNTLALPVGNPYNDVYNQLHDDHFALPDSSM